MSTSKTIRSNQTLVTYNGFGSSGGEYFTAGTPVAEVLTELKRIVGHCAKIEGDKLRRNRITYACLVSDQTGRTLREWKEADLAKL